MLLSVLGYLATSVTVVTSLLLHSRLLCWRGFEGRAAAAERKKEGPGSCIIQVHLFLITPDCSFKAAPQYNLDNKGVKSDIYYRAFFFYFKDGSVSK